MKKRIYSKDKTPRFVATEHIENSFDMLCKIKKIPESEWSTYIKDVVWNDSIQDDFKNIIAEIPNKNMQKAILVYLMHLDNFNPYNPDFSIVEKVDYRRLLFKKKKYYDEYKNFHRRLTIQGFSGTITHTSFNDKPFAAPFKIIFNSHSRKLMFKNQGVSIFDVKNIFEKINEIEPDKWEHNKSYTAIFTKNEVSSKLSIDTLIDILKKNVLG